MDTLLLWFFLALTLALTAVVYGLMVVAFLLFQVFWKAIWGGHDE